MSLTLSEGKDLIAIAKESICAIFQRKHYVPSQELQARYHDKQGVFVTLHKHGQLRGCIGFPEPTLPLADAVSHAAVSAAFEDPRFDPLASSELDDIEIEISVLTIPQKIDISDPKEYLKKIALGKDGLIIRCHGHSGLLLPQVPVEQGWNAEEFLDYLCLKASLPQDAWHDPSSEIFSFQAQIFTECDGEIIEKSI